MRIRSYSDDDYARSTLERFPSGNDAMMAAMESDDGSTYIRFDCGFISTPKSYEFNDVICFCLIELIDPKTRYAFRKIEYSREWKVLSERYNDSIEDEAKSFMQDLVSEFPLAANEMSFANLYIATRYLTEQGMSMNYDDCDYSYISKENTRVVDDSSDR